METSRENHLGRVHYWVRTRFEPSKTCDLCGVPNDGTRKFDWSNKDHKYSIAREDWQHVCRSCHAKHDYKYNGKKTGKGNSLNGKWSMKHDCCIHCGGKESAHNGNGVCQDCFLRRKRIDHRLKNYNPITGLRKRRTINRVKQVA